MAAPIRTSPYFSDPLELHQLGHQSALTRIEENVGKLMKAIDWEPVTKIVNYCLKDTIALLETAEKSIVEDVGGTILSDKEVSNQLYALTFFLEAIQKTTEQRLHYWSKHNLRCPIIEHDGWNFGHMEVSGYMSLSSAISCLSQLGDRAFSIAKEKEAIATKLDSI